MLSCTAAPQVPDDFTVLVRGLSSPEYVWDGPPAFSIHVASMTSPTALVWGIADSTNALRSPLSHGVTPSGATAVVPRPARLRQGTTYLVTITLADGRMGRTQFTLAPISR
jgi:hypothetical protein